MFSQNLEQFQANCCKNVHDLLSHLLDKPLKLAVALKFFQILIYYKKWTVLSDFEIRVNLTHWQAIIRVDVIYLDKIFIANKLV